MKNEKTKTEPVKDVEFTINKMEFEVRKSRLVMETSKGRITVKPMKETTESVRGLIVKGKSPMTINDLPERVFELIRIINEKGSVKVKGSYQCFDAEKDEEVITYRFLNSIKQLESWEIINNEVKREEGSVLPSEIVTEKVDVKAIMRKQLFNKYSKGEIDSAVYSASLKMLNE